MRLWISLRRAGISLLVVAVVAATTAGGLRGALGETGRMVVTVTGRDLGTPGNARSVVDLNGSDDVEVAGIDAAPVASALQIDNGSQQPTAADSGGGSETSPALNNTVLNNTATASSPSGESSAVAGAATEAVSSPPVTDGAKVIDTTTVPKPTTTQLPEPERRVQVGESVPDTAPPTTVEPTTTTAAPTTTAKPTTTTAAPTTTAKPTTTTAKPTTTTAAPTTTAKPTTTTAARPGTVRVSTNGTANGGGFSNTPVGDALERAKPGTRFEFAPGNHETIKVSGVRGDQGNPIVLTAANPSDRPTFTDNSYDGRAGIELNSSSNVSISFVNVRRSMWGIRLEASSGITIDGVRVDDIGQEGIRVMQRSSYVTIRNSSVSNTGRRSGTASDGDPYSTYGEGIYLGTGKDDSDKVHHITVSGNDISRTSSEAIDVKQPAHDVTISGNNIHDIRTSTSGAVVVHIEKHYSASNPNITIRNNTISNISTNSGHRDGVGIAIGSSATVVGNRISNTQHYGIRVDDEGSQGSNITANIRDNTFSNVGRAGIWQTGSKARLNTSNNRGG